MSTAKYMRPFIIELAAMFAAGYIVGKYTQANLPTIAEVRQIANEAAASGKPIPDVEQITGKRPYLSLDNGILSINFKKRGLPG